MRVLLVSSRYPQPPRRGQQVRTMEWLAALADHELAVVCPKSHGAAPLADGVQGFHYVHSPASSAGSMVLGSAAGLPFQEAMYASSRARDAVHRACGEFRPQTVIVQMVRCGWAMDVVRRLFADVPTVFDAIDSMGLHFARRATTSPRLHRPILRAEAGRCAAREQQLAETATRTVAVSARDLAHLGAESPNGRVIPVSGTPAPSGAKRDPRPTVVLTGNLGYRPTVDAALFFAARVWPGVRDQIPGARWILAGARPVRAIRALAALDGIEVSGDVPDLAPILARGWVAVAPMAMGSGVPMKILEAWAAGVPVVAHPWAVEGLADSGRSAVVTAELPHQWLEGVVGLLNDARTGQRLADAGREVWRTTYAPQVVGRQIRALVEEIPGIG